MTREEALKAITAFVENYAYGNDLIGLKMAIEALKEERPHGEWISTLYRTGDRHNYNCSICDEESEYSTPFCPSCGADMRKEGDNK